MAFLALADSDLDASALRQAAVSCCRQKTDVKECIRSAGHGHKTEAFFRIEPFDDCFDRLQSLQSARILRPPYGYSILGVQSSS